MILFQTSGGDDIQLATIIDQKGRTIYSVRRHSGGLFRYFAVRMRNKELWWIVGNAVEEFSKKNHQRNVRAVVRYSEWQSLPDIATRVLASPEFAS